MPCSQRFTGALAAALLALPALAGADERDGGIHYEGESRLANVRQLTFGGQNAEAYFSAGGDELILQSTIGDNASNRTNMARVRVWCVVPGLHS